MNAHIIWIIDHIGTTVEAHTHNFYQMIYCQKKGGEIIIENKKFVAKEDHIYFIKPGNSHSIIQKSNMKVIDLKFTAFENELVEHLSKTPEEFQLKDIAFMKMIFTLIAKEGYDRNLYCNQIINSSLHLLLAKIVHEFNEKPASISTDYNFFKLPPELAKNNTDILIFNLKNYIEANLHRSITLDELANRVNLTKTYFVKRFKELFEEPPIKFILNMRIEKAKQLILEGKLSMQEIAYKVGFNSLHYFSRIFKQIEGISPSEYRKYFKR